MSESTADVVYGLIAKDTEWKPYRCVAKPFVKFEKAKVYQC